MNIGAALAFVKHQILVVWTQLGPAPAGGSKPLTSNGLCNRAALLDNLAPRRAPLNPAAGPPGGPSGPPERSGSLDKKLCQVGGVNQNYTSAAGTLYHIQIEDLGP